jgi:hypothetical protein
MTISKAPAPAPDGHGTDSRPVKHDTGGRRADLVTARLVVVVIVLAVVSLGAGRYWLSPGTVIRVLFGLPSAGVA